MKRRQVVTAGLAAGLLGPSRARAQTRPLRIGVLNDMNGVFAEYLGPGSVVAAKMAAMDSGGSVAGQPIEILSADHQNRPDVGLAIARNWIDQDGVDAIVDVPNSSIALAVADLCRDRNKVFIGSGAGIADLTGRSCAPTTVHWTYDTWEVSHALGKIVTAQGGKTWFTVTADYSFGADLDRNLTEAVKAAGGTIVGGVKHPFQTADFSSFLLQAKASRAQVLALNNAGGDTATALKQAAEFGLTSAMQVCGPIYNINMAHAVGLDVTAGVLAALPFYWDMNDGTRRWSRRYAASSPANAMPNDMQAGVYSGLLHYVKAVAQLGHGRDGAKIVAAMKAIPTDDPLFGKGRIRVDGRKLHPVYLFKTKTPAESQGAWDLLTVTATLPADQAFRPLSEGGCKLAS